MSDVTTEGIRIKSTVTFLPERSGDNQWLFSYTITISNEGTSPAQLLRRHWIITDGWEQVEEVEGEGVVGEQPRLEPGESFQYTSFCPLLTPTGTMRGTYRMVRDSGQEFDAQVGPFLLRDPSLN